MITRTVNEINDVFSVVCLLVRLIVLLSSTTLRLLSFTILQIRLHQKMAVWSNVVDYVKQQVFFYVSSAFFTLDALSCISPMTGESSVDFSKCFDIGDNLLIGSR